MQKSDEVDSDGTAHCIPECKICCFDKNSQARRDFSAVFLCEECNVAVCTQCSLQDQHKNHTVKPFLAAAQETKNTILGVLQSANSRIKQLENCLQRLKSPTAKSLKTNARPGLRRAGSHTPPGVSPRNLDSSCGQQPLLDEEKTLNDSKNRLKSACAEIEKLLQEYSLEAILKLRRLQTLKIPPISAESRPRNSAKSTETRILNDNRAFVCAITSGLAKDGTITTIPGKEVKLRLFFWSRDVRSRPAPVEDVSCFLENSDKHAETGAETGKIQLRPLRTDTVEASFVLEKESLYRLHILLAGHPVNGSPYNVFVRCPAVRVEALRESLFSPCSSVVGWKKDRLSPRSGSVMSGSQKKNSNRVSESEEEDLLVARIGSVGRDLGYFLNPQGICIANEEFIAVTDSNIGCIQVFTIDGLFLKRFGERGRRPGQIIRPTGIAFLPKCQNRWNVDVYVVADYENRTVVLFDMEGKILTSFGSAKLTGPKGVAVAVNGDILVVDNRSNSLFVFRSCKFYRKIWSPSSTAAHLAGPHYVAVSRDTGDVLISDFHHHSIKVFDAQYNYRWSFGSFSADAGMGSFSGPTGVVADHRGIVVADWGSGRIQVFDSNGSFVSYVTTLSSPLYGPQGIALAQDGTIFACDSGNHTVRVYRHPLP